MAKRLLNITPQTRSMRFDTEEDCRQIYRMFGEPDRIEADFPHFFAALKEAQAAPPQTAEPTGYIDWLTVYGASYDSETKQLEIDYNITLKQTCAQLFAYIYDGSGELFESLFYANTQTVNTTCIFKDVELSKGDSLELFVECPFVAGNETILRGLKASLKATYSELVIADITVKHPILRHSKSAPIKVVYDRTLDVADYCYPESRAGNGNQNFFLEVEGSVILLQMEKETYTVKSISSTQACIMSGGQYGSIIYRNRTGQKIEIFEDKTGFSWVFDKAWHDEISSSVQFGEREYIFDMGIIFKCNETGNIDHRVHVTSNESGTLAPDKVIPKIKLYWGCLSKDSMVQMAEGSQKKISQICCGDSVATPDGSAQVRDVIKGTDQFLYRLVTEQGLAVSTSIMHPVLTDKGFIPIRDVAPETMVVTRDGLQPVRHCYEVEYDDMVYGLELDGAECFTADGIAVGTNEVQGRMLAIPLYRESDMCESLRAEFERMKAFAESRRMSNGESISDQY